MTYQGVFGLHTARDLLAKVRRDLKRLERNPQDTDAAFDLFVTARHVPDWIEATGGPDAAKLFAQHVELRVCRHIADGAKHFEATRSNHKQVSGTTISPGGFYASGFSSAAFQVGHLSIDLDSTDTATVAFGGTIDAVRLARRVIEVLDSVVP